MVTTIKVKINQDYSITLPPGFIEQHGLMQGDELTLSDEGEFALLYFLPHKKSTRTQQVGPLLKALRESVKQAGGITNEEIEDAIRKVRAQEVQSNC
jgi:bifunctional DNA-binding transcriptional regulator/antitoxin component of YhaV-PrlF toxin-antitoxin module